MTIHAPSPSGDDRVDARWRSILDAVVAVQALLPKSTMIGGSAVTVHTGHRLSGDADLVLRDLDRDWHRVRGELEELESWITDYPKIPTNLMGRYGDVRVSVRKLNRVKDIDIIEVPYRDRVLRVAAPADLVRMKALAILSRNLTRDYVDMAALDMGLREVGRSAAEAITALDEYYVEHKSAGSLAREVVSKLAAPAPREREPQASLDEFVALRQDLRQWSSIVLACQRIAAEVE